MTLLDDAKIITTANAAKAGTLYSIKPDSGLADLDITRATTATRVDSAGVIESVAVNEPQLDYSDGSCPSFLLEPQRTNLAFPSATAATQTVTTTTAAHSLSFYGTGSVTLTGTHSATLNGTGASNRVTLTFTPSSGSLTMTIAGSVTNIQLEVGSYSSSYIPTTVASVTRNQTTFSKTGLSSLMSDTEGTFFLELDFDFDGDYSFFSIGADTSNTVAIGAINHTNLWLRLLMGGTGINAFWSSPGYPSGFFKIAAKYKSGDFAVWLNGTEIQTNSSSATSSATWDKVSSAYAPNINIYNPCAKLRQMQVYDTALTDAQLLALTS